MSIRATILALISLFCIQLSSQASLSFLLEPVEKQKEEVLEPVEAASEVVLEAVLEEAVESNASFNLPKIEITQQAAEEELAKILKEYYDVEGSLTIHMDKDTFQPILATANDWSIQITEFPGKGVESRFKIGFILLSQGKEISSWKMRVSASIWRDAFVSEKFINRGTLLSESDFKIQPIDVLSIRGSSVKVTEKLSTYEANQTVPAGDVLVYRDLKRKPDIFKGQIVDIVAKEGLMRIVMKAQALEDGIQDNFISVRNLTTNKKLQILVIDEGVGQIFF